MTIDEIADSINNYISNYSSLLNNFQYYRRLAKEKQKGNDLFFSKKSISIVEEYAFHYGGRSEIQFNIGVDKNLFRYGLAFSLEPSPSYHEPEIILKRSIQKFNDFISVNLENYKYLKMWYWDKNGRSEILEISKIPKSWIQRGNFIFIGNYFEKGINDVNNKDIEIIVKHFEVLFNIYKYVELTTEKMAKICWNTKGWIKPCGSEGKSLDKDSYEKINGFGHEEWLFDFNKIINGYHYAALQPVGKYQSKYANKFFNILLYTYNSKTKEWFWVGWLNNVQAISKDEAIEIYEEYKKNGWIEEMKNNLNLIKANSSELDTFTQDVFNIKFYPKDLKLFNEDLKLFGKNEKITHNRYTLLNLNQLDSIPKDIQIFEIIHNENDQSKGTSLKKTFHAKTKEYENIHELIHDSFFKYLKNRFPKDKISKEAELTGLNCKLDIYHEMQSSNLFIYEIKSYNDIRISFRASIGQLLEYAYYPKRIKKVKLMLVTHKVASEEIKSYLANLNELFKLDIGYIGFDYGTNNIIDEYNYL